MFARGPSLHTRRILLFTAMWGLTAAATRAEDVVYHAPIKELRIIEGKLPDMDFARLSSWQRERAAAMGPMATLDGEGEIHVVVPGNIGRDIAFAVLAIRTPQRRDVTGWLSVPKDDLSGTTRVRFSVPADAGSITADARQRFYAAAEAHYRKLVERGASGGAWFRSQLRTARLAQDKEPGDGAFTGRRRGGLHDTFELFTGGRAISENLQLDRSLTLLRDDGGDVVPIDSLKGITIAALDWKALLKDAHPKLDTLAANVPHDQYAFFFGSFDDLLKSMDEFDQFGVEALQYVEPRAEDARLGPWYRRQLCIEVTRLDRLLGDKLVASVAMTGSDPYLRTGTDCAVLFEPKNADALYTYLRTKQTVALTEHTGAKEERGKLNGVDYVSVRSPQRRLCSYVFRLGDVVGVANSTAQLQRLIDTAQGRHAALASLDEYKFFRHRYERGKETGFLMLSDAAIRRLCSPLWRIGSSRRTRAAAILAELQAESLEDMAGGRIEPAGQEHPLGVSGMGRIGVYPDGVRSATYGTSEFLAPIAELPMDKVSKAEADAYTSWRTAYERSWRGYFDPIAIQFSLRPERMTADMTVIPLIGGSEYQWLIQLAGRGKITQDAADAHASAIAHLSLALDSPEIIKQADEFLSALVGVKNCLSWLGGAVSIYIDDDPVWADFAKASDPEQFWRDRDFAMPLAVYFDSTDEAKLKRFLSGAQRALDSLLGRDSKRETRRHNGIEYYKGHNYLFSTTSKQVIYSAPAPHGLIISLTENTLKKALDRQTDRRRGEPKLNNVPPRLGDHLTVYATAQAVDIWQKVVERDYRTDPQLRCWSNLPILNEWKRRFPDQHPVALHRKYWNMLLKCPGGGEYVWNAKWQTMESTAFGHPGEPKRNVLKQSRLNEVRSLNFGVTFENQGLRAKAVIARKPAKD